MRLIEPDWEISGNVKAFFTCREDGFSEAPFDSLNLSNQVGDFDKTVEKNRGLLNFLRNHTILHKFMEQIVSLLIRP